MPITLHASFSSLQPQAAAWNQLARGNPFLSWEWLTRWWEAYGEDKELFLLAAQDEQGRLLGAAPWYSTQSALSGRTIDCIGSGEVCADYLGILAHAGCEDEVVNGLADWLVKANAAAADPKSKWDLLRLTGLARLDGLTARFVEQLVDAGCTVHRKDGMNCWRLLLPDTWEAYEEMLSNSHRKQVRRIDKKLLRSGRAVLRVAATDEQLDLGFEILIRLHQARRQSLGQPGCFSSEKFHRFIQNTARDLLPADRVRLYWLELDGRPAAAEIHWLGGGTLYAYQAGVDPERLDEEPGRAITIAILQQAVEERLPAIDFLRGDEPYKAHFRAEKQPLDELRIVAPKGLAQVRHGVWLAGDTLKGLVKSSLNLSGMR